MYLPVGEPLAKARKITKINGLKRSIVTVIDRNSIGLFRMDYVLDTATTKCIYMKECFKVYNFLAYLRGAKSNQVGDCLRAC